MPSIRRASWWPLVSLPRTRRGFCSSFRNLAQQSVILKPTMMVVTYLFSVEWALVDLKTKMDMKGHHSKSLIVKNFWICTSFGIFYADPRFTCFDFYSFWH